jgi:hypothetical protein
MNARLHLELMPDWMTRGDGQGLQVLSQAWHGEQLRRVKPADPGSDASAIAPAHALEDAPAS